LLCCIKNCPVCGQKSVYRDGKSRLRQRYRCKHCKHVWLQPKSEESSWVEEAYGAYTIGRQTIAELSQKYNCSERTLRNKFDDYRPPIAYEKEAALCPVPLVFDGTFFGRGYGLLVYRALGKNIYWREIDNEKIAYIEQDLLHLKASGWIFSSFTIDGRRGVIQCIERLFTGTPIQMCLFHQKKSIQRYLTLNPKTECGKEIKKLMENLKMFTENEFLNCLQKIKQDYKEFLKERNENNQFMHRKLRAALRSLTTNLPYLFTHKNYPVLNIPTTTNSCDGSFAHWKAKTKIHRGLQKNRRTKMINFLLVHS
jgi:hypothetical protein